MGFDKDVYEEVQSSLEAIKAKVRALQDQADGKAILEQSRQRWQERKDAYARKAEDQRQANLHNVEKVFDDHHAGVVSEFRRHKAEPPTVLPTSLKPEIQAGFSAGNQQPVSFESKWVQPKVEKKAEPPKTGLFRSLWNRLTGSKPEKVPAPHDPVQKNEQKHIRTPEEMAMPHWAKAVLSKVKEVDETVLRKVKDEAKGWVQLPTPKDVPSFMQQPQKEEPKKGFFSRAISSLAGKAASWF